LPQILLGQITTILVQPTLQDFHRWKEIVTNQHHQVDVVGIPLATEAMRQVVLRIHRCSQLPTVRALETEVTITVFADWVFENGAVLAEPRDR